MNYSFICIVIIYLTFCLAQNEDGSFYPEACVKFTPSTDIINPNHRCSSLGISPRGRSFSSLVCEPTFQTKQESWHSWSKAEQGFFDILPNCPGPFTNFTLFNNNTDFEFGFWDCRDSVSNIRTPECFPCEHIGNTTGCYGVDSTYRSTMRNIWPCAISTAENSSCLSETVLCKCTWRCAKNYVVLFEGDTILNPTTGNEEVTGAEGLTRAQLLDLAPKCENVTWQYLSRAQTEDDVYESFIKFDGKVVSITVNPAGEFNVIFYKGDFREFKTFTGTSYQFQTPAEWRQVSGYLTVELYSAGIKIDSQTFEIVGFNNCDIADCVLCSNFFTTIGCAPFTIKIAYIVLFTIFLVALCVAFPVLWVIIIILFKIIYAIFRKLMSMSYNLMKKTPGVNMMADEYQKIVNEPQSVPLEETNTDMDNNLSFAEKLNRSRRKKETKLLPFVFLFIGLSILPNARACDNGLVIPTTLSNCVVDGSLETCSMSFEVVVGVPMVSGVSCLTLTDPQSSKVFANVNITLDSILHTFPLNLAYYTSDRNVIVESHRLCFDLFGGFCHSNLFSDFEPCSEINLNPNQYINSIRGTSLFFDTRVNGHPVRQTCRRVQGTLSNGCGASQSGCVVSRAGVVPINDPYAVLIAGASGTLQSMIKVNVDHDGSDFSFNCLGNSISCANNNITLFIDATSSTQELSVNGLCVLKGANTLATGSCSDQNTYVAGQYGELKSNTSAGFASGNFLFANDLFNVVENGNENFYQVSQGPFKTVNTAVLPGFLSELYMREQSGKLLINGTGSVQLRLKTNQPFTVTRKTSLVCPQMTFVSATGCSQCSSGVDLKFTGKSTCAAGNALVSDDLDETVIYTNSLNLTTDLQTFSVRLRTDKIDNSFNMLFGSGAQKIKVPVSFSVPIVIDIANNSYVVSRGTVTEDPSGSDPLSFDASDFFTRAFLGRGSAVEIVTVVAIFVVVGIILVVISIWLIRSGRSFKILNKISNPKKTQ